MPRRRQERRNAMSKTSDKMFKRRAEKLHRTLVDSLSMLTQLVEHKSDLLRGAMLCESTMQARREASDLNNVVCRIDRERYDAAKGGAKRSLPANNSSARSRVARSTSRRKAPSTARSIRTRTSAWPRTSTDGSARERRAKISAPAAGPSGNASERKVAADASCALHLDRRAARQALHHVPLLRRRHRVCRRAALCRLRRWHAPSAGRAAASGWGNCLRSLHGRAGHSGGDPRNGNRRRAGSTSTERSNREHSKQKQTRHQNHT